MKDKVKIKSQNIAYGKLFIHKLNNPEIKFCTLLLGLKVGLIWQTKHIKFRTRKNC